MSTLSDLLKRWNDWLTKNDRPSDLREWLQKVSGPEEFALVSYELLSLEEIVEEWIFQRKSEAGKQSYFALWFCRCLAD